MNFCTQIQNLLRTQLSSSIATRKKLVSDLEHSQAATVTLREQVGNSAKFYTEALQAAGKREATLQKELESYHSKLEDAGVAFENLSELLEVGRAEEDALQHDLEELKQVQYEHTRWFCQKELPILQAINTKHGFHAEMRAGSQELQGGIHNEHLRSDEGSNPNY